MKTAPVVAASVEIGADGLPWSAGFGDRYHAAGGALAQARHVFLGGNRLLGPAPRWAGRADFTLLETGFGLGHNFLATWDAWRRDPRRSTRLHFVSIDKHPPTRADLQRLLADSELPELARQLVAAWPPLTPGLHLLDFEGGALRLMLGFGDVEALLPEVLARVDAFYLDGFAPARNPAMWEPRMMERLARLAAPGATVATWSAAHRLRKGLAAAGFRVESAPGFAGKQEMTVAEYAPHFQSPPPPGGLLPAPSHEHAALVIGAGLAGCATAAALARIGWHCTVLDALSAPARSTSGNAAGLMHATLHADDGPHARLLRAGALRMARAMAPLLASGEVHGALDGFLRLEPRLDDAGAAGLLGASGLPVEFVRWLGRYAASARSGLALATGGWYYPEGGWLAPGEVAAAWLRASGARFIGDLQVARLAPTTEGWTAFDADGAAIASAPVVVLANALAAAPLLRHSLGDAAVTALGPLAAVRGQVSAWRWQAGMPNPRCAVSGAGYTLPPLDGWLWAGATSQHHDAATELRAADHVYNRDRLAQLAGIGAESVGTIDAAIGRVGWRAVAPDRLPMVGALPDLAALAPLTRADAARLVPRWRDEARGLYVFTGLGSRGLTTAAIGAELLASWIGGVPCPLEADLRDALDPARFALRARRLSQELSA
ncbi:FAD-dependent 5-carboxymethylaminomethyl-2-thiouridine(34) oxidoreductase MnmC [Rivibacter subsaxonicus]|uniref:tRNA 5-methylaminomethyl-2-thiouridine biosynthesis bifunctional protein MnmC n=1 Tax=Rivibacter subsaxonicus TaxID=457575 RepID=A0A4Q7VCS2_9BURK|nr:FAD-dependent 5-carboxymethylaminomethyl-2-thiouridine(34) oxidoreductase MnmC [Rivibacter subsaxonicus]RZT92548.1 tRNA 5-methylaminomethyl-2-thiouridine biosynthesis bifunctional protein [Rivibacter subsaxonicus]